MRIVMHQTPKIPISSTLNWDSRNSNLWTISGDCYPTSDRLNVLQAHPVSETKMGGGGCGSTWRREPPADYRAAAQRLRSYRERCQDSHGFRSTEIKSAELTKKEKPRFLTKFTKGLYSRNK